MLGRYEFPLQVNGARLFLLVIWLHNINNKNNNKFIKMFINIFFTDAFSPSGLNVMCGCCVLPTVSGLTIPPCTHLQRRYSWWWRPPWSWSWHQGSWCFHMVRACQLLGGSSPSPWYVLWASMMVLSVPILLKNLVVANLWISTST